MNDSKDPQKASGDHPGHPRDEINSYPFVDYQPAVFSPQEVQDKASAVRSRYEERRSIREFSDRPVSRETIQQIIMAASTAPSGAHKQPWTFCAVSDPVIKTKIREAAEKEEYESYNGRMPESWLRDLAPLGTDWRKPFLETAPWLIVVFRRIYELDEQGQKHNNYYVNESVGLASGFLLTAIHQAGLCSLTHTPSPMNFLAEVLGRPSNEKPFLLVPVGYPADGCQVPDLSRKPESEVIAWYE